MKTCKNFTTSRPMTLNTYALSGRLVYRNVPRGVETPGLGIMSLRDNSSGTPFG